jgi:hypothetical protein
MPGVKDLDGIFLHAIGNDVRQSLMQQFARALLNTLAPAMGKSFERPGGLLNLCDSGMRQMRWCSFKYS